MDNRNIGENGTAAFSLDGDRRVSGVDSTPTRAHAQWAHLDGVGGYVFGQRTPLALLREDRSGRWTDMDRRGVYEDDTLYTRRFATMWIEHGTDPTDARYAYVQLPAASRTDTELFARRGVVEVLANTPAVQAARRRDLGLTMANVWTSGAPPVGGISVDRTASVVVSDVRGTLGVAICDPTQLLTGTVTVDVSVPARRYLGGDAEVHARCHGNSVSLTVDLTGSAGRSYVARFRR